LAEGDRLGALPERQAAELGELLPALEDRREVVARERTGLRCECTVAVREEQLRLADPAGIEQELARGRGAGRVLCADAELAVAPGNPVRLAAPATMDDPVLEWKDPAERRDGAGSVFFEEARAEGVAGGDDLEHAADATGGRASAPGRPARLAS